MSEGKGSLSSSNSSGKSSSSSDDSNHNKSSVSIDNISVCSIDIDGLNKFLDDIMKDMKSEHGFSSGKHYLSNKSQKTAETNNQKKNSQINAGTNSSRANVMNLKFDLSRFDEVRELIRKQLKKRKKRHNDNNNTYEQNNKNTFTVKVIRRNLANTPFSYGLIAHSALLVSYNNNKTYVVEVLADSKAHITKVNSLKTINATSTSALYNINGVQWTGQRIGKTINNDKNMTIDDIKQTMQNCFSTRGDYNISIFPSKRNVCHDAQQCAYYSLNSNNISLLNSSSGGFSNNSSNKSSGGFPNSSSNKSSCGFPTSSSSGFPNSLSSGFPNNSSSKSSGGFPNSSSSKSSGGFPNSSSSKSSGGFPNSS
jgi:hypothetical protein